MYMVTNKYQANTKVQSSMDKPETLATLGTRQII